MSSNRAAIDHRAPTTKLQKLKPAFDSYLILNVPTKSHNINHFTCTYFFSDGRRSTLKPGSSLSPTSDQTKEKRLNFTNQSCHTTAGLPKL